MKSRRTTRTNRRYLRALAALSVGLCVISAAPARADHHVSFFFGFPAPPIPVPVFAPPVYYAPPPPVYYAPPPAYYYGPRRVYYYGPPVYYAPWPAYYHGRHYRRHYHRY